MLFNSTTIYYTIHNHASLQESNMTPSKKWTFNLFTSLFVLLFFSSTYASPWPVATTDNVTVDKNSTISISVLENDTGTGLLISQIDNWSENGGQSVIDSTNKKITYTPAPNYVGSDTFWYDMIDNQGRTNSAAVQITVNESNLPPSSDAWPTATPDSVTVLKNNSIAIDVLVNDIGLGLSITETDAWTEKAGQTSHNTSNNIVTYTPAPNFIGTDTFWYSFKDNQERTNAAMVTVVITNSTTPPPSNEWPTATLDTATTSVDQSINIPVLANDIGNGLTLTDIDTWTMNAGRAYIDSTNTFVTYIPFAGFTGVDSFWYTFADNQGRTNAAEVQVTVTQNTMEFSHVQMHYGLLKNQPIVWGEFGSQEPYTEAIQNIQLTSSASLGSTTLSVASNSGLLSDQLIVYKATNNDYYVTKIANLVGNHTINLAFPLEANISGGHKAWNFYANPSHPNRYGYKAIADFSFRSLNLGTNTTGKHVLLGDSWFDNNGVSTQRFNQKLPQATIINEGIGGNTSQDLIDRFDSDVTPHSPDTIWIICGTNDYWQGVSTATFKANLQTLINKSKAIGAEVIIIDSSVGIGTGISGVSNFLQSGEYANALLQLNQ